MEYFYAGVLFAQNLHKFADKDHQENKLVDYQFKNMTDQILKARTWAARMQLSFKQKSLYFYNQFASDGVSDSSTKDNEEVFKKPIVKPRKSGLKDSKKASKRPHLAVEDTSAFDSDHDSDDSHLEKSKNGYKRPKLADSDDSDDDRDTKHHRSRKYEESKEEAKQDPSDEAKQLVVGDCKICLDDIQMDEVQGIDTCAHLFHKECLQTHLETSIDSNKIPLVCPIVECKEEVPFGIIRETLTKKYVERFDLFSFKMAMNQNAQKFMACPTPDCEYVVCVEGNDLQVNPEFKCPSCSIEYCLECESEWHDGMNCDQFQRLYGKGKLDFNDHKAIQHAIDNGMRRCPHCRIWVIKISGCDSVYCGNCRQSFNYNQAETS
ncbi:unnamed protein product [Moneuplotes crassus]|uniref:Uncharacterized protein n=1 Tax=Euplotes crassus TaxID=5936 RepID=A0AAD1USP9_EUPCR|nr:unnamed protein product [Moneuplotes crassus]